MASGKRGGGRAKLSNDRARIVFTTGTLAGSEGDFYETAIKACEILVTSHRRQIPDELPPRVTHVEYAPFDELFATASAVVHHGGVGTGAHALLAGIPQIVRPLAGDHFDIANRIERLGVGRIITKGRVGASELARILRSVSGSARIRNRCEYWAARVRSENGLARVADLIEDLSGFAEGRQSSGADV